MVHDRKCRPIRGKARYRALIDRVRICQECKTANEPLATACANCNAPLSESDHHIVVEPAFIDDIPSLEEVSRYQGATIAADPEPPIADGAATPKASGNKLSFVVSASPPIARRDPAASPPSEDTPLTDRADVAASSSGAGTSPDEPQELEESIEHAPSAVVPPVVENTAAPENSPRHVPAEPPPLDVLQRPSAARFRLAAPIEEPAAENVAPFDGDDHPPVVAPEPVAGGAEIPRAPVSAIRPYARKEASTRRPVSRRNLGIAAAFGVLCVALLAIVPLVNAIHKGSPSAVAVATGSPAGAASGAPDLTTSLGASPASTAPQPTPIAATPAPTPQAKRHHNLPAIARNTKPAERPHPKPAAAPKPTATPKPIPTPKPTATATPKPPVARTPAPTPQAHLKPAAPPVKPIALHHVRKPITTPTLLASPRVAAAPLPTVSQAPANQPLVIRSSLGRSSAVSLATGGASGLPDLRWHKLSADQWQLLTVNGASAHRLGVIGYPAFFAITANDLAHYSYEPAALSSISGNDLNGTVLAVRTNGGAYAKVYIQESNYATTVYYNLYAAGSSK